MLHVRCCSGGKQEASFSGRSTPLRVGRTNAVQEVQIPCEGGFSMLWTICVVLLVLWLLGIVTAYTLGGFIHILLLLAIAAVLIRIIQGRRIA